MFGKKIQKKLHTTQRFGKVDAPAVSEETLEKYHSLYNTSVEGAAHIHALVLGATPELRDIVLSYGHKLTTVDVNEEAIAEKTMQMHYQHHANEDVIVSDWLSVEFNKDSFDIILGDGVLTALPQEQQQLLLDKLHTWLKPTGHLLLREGAVLHRRPRYTPMTHIHEYRTGQYNLFDLFFGLRLYNQNFKSIDVETRRTYLAAFQTKMREYYDEGLLSKEEYDQLMHVGAELEHTLLHKEDLENLLRKMFTQQSVVHDIGSGHLSPWYFFLTQPSDVIDLPKHVPLNQPSYVQQFLAKASAPDA